MNFREFTTGSVDYQRELALREAVMRAPLGLSLRNEDLSAEKDQLHFGLFEADGTLVASVIAAPLADGQVKIRQMAVASSRQRRGLETRIMGELEKTLVARGFHRFVLHARVAVVGFYRKLGYVAVGGEFIEVTIPHVRMEKTVTAKIRGFNAKLKVLPLGWDAEVGRPSTPLRAGKLKALR